MLFLSLILWLLTLIVALRWWQSQAWHPRQIVRQLEQPFSKKEKQASLLQTLAHYKWLSRPGWIVRRWVTAERYDTKLNAAGQPLTFAELQTGKQVIVSVFSLSFWLFIWFGDVTVKNLFLILSLGLLVWYLPDLWLLSRRDRWQAELRDEVPYFVDLLSLTLQSGMNLEQAFAAVTTTMDNPLSRSVRHHLRNLNYGQSFDTVLRTMKSAITVDEWQHFLGSVTRAKKLGVSLSKTLAIQSDLIRTQRRQRAEELSRTAATKISLPLVLFIFPALLIIYLGPGMLQLLARS